MKKIYYLLLPIILIFVFIVFYPFPEKLTLYDLLYNSGRVAGLTALFFFAILVISGDLARFFDRFFGIDKIIKFQREFSLITLVFVLLHPIFFIIANKNFNYLIPNFAYIGLSFGIVSFYFYLVIMLCSYFYKRISYYAWQFIHIVIYIALIFAFLHAFRYGSDVDNIFVRYLFILLIGLFVIGIIYRTFYKLKQLKNKFYVEKIDWETKDTFTIKLKQYVNGLENKKLKFKAGQFCFLRLNKENLFARHPFTISSYDEETLNFTIKLQGKFTKIASELKKGEQVIVEGPFGIFTLDKAFKEKNKEKDLVFFAGGVGITPFMSFLKFLAKSDQESKLSNRKIFLFYGVRTDKDIIGKKLFDDLLKNKNLKNKLNIVYCISQECSIENRNKKNFEMGYINKELILKYLDSFENKLYYICGPEPMKNSIIKILKENNVKEKDVFYESFFW
ncbi:MAG: ferric reductase-like transmembrane domain-containing protein [Candidatus Woesearchaeota archaeon]